MAAKKVNPGVTFKATMSQISVPATSANIGPGFDCLGLALEMRDRYAAQILDDAPNREGVKYTYGQRLRSWFGRDQIEKVIDKLANDIDSARAVMSLWDASQDDNDNPPCLNHIWVRIVDNELSLTATFRSNDMFSAWPANAMGLRALQKYIYNSLVKKTAHKLKMGALITISQSAHIYDDCFEITLLIKILPKARCFYFDLYYQNFYIHICGQPN
jgi:thymidylate synthase (methanogen type)